LDCGATFLHFPLDSKELFGYDSVRMDELLVQGRPIGSSELGWIGELMAVHPEWGRSQLSIHIAQRWNWRNAVGRLKDMAARSLLLKLERRGLLCLPPRQRPGTANHKARRAGLEPELPLDPISQDPLRSALAPLRPLRVMLVENALGRRDFARLLQQHHYLGYSRPVGENLPYLVQSRCGRPLACALFGAAAWKCAPRDLFIGWGDQARQEHLQSLANNMRLLILPWVHVPLLASHLLGILARRVSGDWQRKYGHRIYLLETFVEQERFAGTSYRAANWIHLGQTQGRGRQGPAPGIRSASIKDIYLWPLHPRFRQLLHGASPSEQIAN
jgi:hypothetical protein